LKLPDVPVEFWWDGERERERERESALVLPFYPSDLRVSSLPSTYPSKSSDCGT